MVKTKLDKYIEKVEDELDEAKREILDLTDIVDDLGTTQLVDGKIVNWPFTDRVDELTEAVKRLKPIAHKYEVLCNLKDALEDEGK